MSGPGTDLRTALASALERVTRNRLRVAFVVLVALSALVVVGAATSNDLSTASADEVPEAPETENHTVVTESGRAGTITVYEPSGEVAYYNNSRTKYFDADPVEGEPNVIEYAATDTIHSEGPTCSDPTCAVNVVERVNVETGETEVVYERYDAQENAAEWHDADRIDDERLVVADMIHDQVFIVNTTTEVVEWLWDAQSDFPVEEGGPYPTDWAHINDVEYIDAEGDPNDGRIMVSLRNQDQVVFLDREEGLVDDWTLGSENDYDVQYEQHNPDYIPESRGGPAVVVADSENGRVQEFQRDDGEWTRSWEWSDARMQWPRDADRLPNGNTLIADSHGQRVFEVDEDGEIVWEVPSTLPYEAERLETGDESTGGHSADSLDLQSHTEADSGGDGGGGGGSGILSAVDVNPFDRLGNLLQSILPHRIYNGILFATPVWMGKTEFAAVGVALLTGLVWSGVEVRWILRDRGVRFRSPVFRRKR